MVVIELHFVVVLTLQSGGYQMCVVILAHDVIIIQPMLCYFNRSLNFISAHTSVGIYIASVFLNKGSSNASGISLI